VPVLPAFGAVTFPSLQTEVILPLRQVVLRASSIFTADSAGVASQGELCGLVSIFRPSRLTSSASVCSGCSATRRRKPLHSLSRTWTWRRRNSASSSSLQSGDSGWFARTSSIRKSNEFPATGTTTAFADHSPPVPGLLGYGLLKIGPHGSKANRRLDGRLVVT